MKLQAPVSPERAPHVDGSGLVSDNSYAFDLYLLDKERKLDAPGHRSRRRGLNSLATLFSVLAVAAVLVSCFRAARVKTPAADAGRRLAGEPPQDEDRAEFSVLLDACLDLEEATGSTVQPTPLLSPGQAIPLIVQSLFGHTTQGGSQQASVPLPLTSESTAPPSSPKPGPSHVELAGLEGEGLEAWDAAVREAVASMQWATAASSLTAPAYSLPYHDVEGASQANEDLRQLRQFLPPISQQEQMSGSSQDAAAGPSWSSAAPGMSATPHQGRPPAEPHQPGAEPPVTGQKRPLGTLETEGYGVFGPLETQKAPGQPQPKKHTLGWKKKEPSPASQPPFPSEEQGLQGTFSADLLGDPLLRAIQAVPVVWSPPALDVTDSVGDTPRESGEKGRSPFLKAIEAVPNIPRIPDLAFSLSGELPAGEMSPSATASASSPASWTSPGLGGTRIFLPEDPLSGPPPDSSGSSSSASLSPENDSNRLQAAFPGPLPGTSSPTSFATHLFYRLPTVLPGAIPAMFDAARVFSSSQIQARPSQSLSVMRQLLTKPEITPQEAASLVQHSQVLVRCLLFDFQIPCTTKKMSRVVLRLGRLYLMLDAVLSAVAVAGPSMAASTWWPRLAEQIPSRVTYAPSPRSKLEAKVVADLATDLSYALHAMRNGVRLGPKETVDIKRRLLCTSFTSHEFQDAKWEPWREDDKKSGAATLP